MIRLPLTLLYFLAPAASGTGYLTAVAVGFLVADLVLGPSPLSLKR